MYYNYVFASPFIANNIAEVTKNYKLAFGTFVDKTVAPFIEIGKM